MFENPPSLHFVDIKEALPKLTEDSSFFGDPICRAADSAKKSKHLHSVLDEPNLRMLSLDPDLLENLSAIRPLEWNSRFLHRTVFSLCLLWMKNPDSSKNCKTNANLLVRLSTLEAINDGADLVIVKMPKSVAHWTEALVDSGYAKVSEQVELLRDPVNQEPPFIDKPATVLLRDYHQADLESIKAIGRGAFETSHFLADKNLSRESCLALFEQWTENDCNGRADFLIVAERQGRIAGFVAGFFDTAYESAFEIKKGHIDLLAIAPEFRGKKIGAALASAAVDRFTKMGARAVTVATQSDALAALSLYKKIGFQEVERQIVFHGWKNEILMRLQAGGLRPEKAM